jgi:hypothetical protein
VSCGFAALTLDCRSCGPGFGGLSGEAELGAVAGSGESAPVAEQLSTAPAAAVLARFAEGSYRWQGELRLWDNEALLGWYRSIDEAVRSKGTLYLALHPHGDHAWGRWVGMSYDGVVISGWGSLARTQEQANQIVQDLIDERLA